MKYVKQHFVTGMKVSLPDVLNRMEAGIAAACGAAVEGIGSVTTGDTPAEMCIRDSGGSAEL